MDRVEYPIELIRSKKTPRLGTPLIEIFSGVQLASDISCSRLLKMTRARFNARSRQDLQTDALEAVGCEKIFAEKVSGAQRDRPELTAALEYIRAGDTLICSISPFHQTAYQNGRGFREDGIGFKALTENIATTQSYTHAGQERLN